MSVVLLLLFSHTDYMTTLKYEQTTAASTSGQVGFFTPWRGGRWLPVLHLSPFGNLLIYS
jgi:hypothetical protein